MPVPSRPLNIRVVPAVAPTGLLQAGGMTYLGAFKIPGGSCGGGDQCTANYGGTCLAFDPAGNGGLGTLYVNSLDTSFGRLVAEISVENDLTGGAINPADTALSQMPTAKLIQPWGDIFAGQIDTISPGSSNWMGGLLVTDYLGVSRIVGTAYNSFGVASTRKSHFILKKSTTDPQVIVGPFEVNGTGVTGPCNGGENCPDGWVAQSSVEIPAAYQAALGGDMLSGMMGASLIGRTSFGPTATRWTKATTPGNPTAAKKLLGYPSSHPELGNWVTEGPSGGAELFTSQNDANRMFWPTGYRTLAYIYILGNVNANCYGAAVAGGAGDPVEDAIGEIDRTGTGGSSNGAGTTITLPNANLTGLRNNAWVWFTAQTSPAVVFAGRNYRGIGRILSVANSGTPTAAVTVAPAQAFPPNLTAQAWKIGAPAAYDPSVHGNTIPDTEPRSGHGPTAYPYQVIVSAYDVNDLAAVQAGTKSPWQLRPYAVWTLTLPVQFPAGKYAKKDLGAVAFDPINRRLYLTQRYVDGPASTIVLVYQIAAP